MTRLELKNHQFWQDLTEILQSLDANLLVQEAGYISLTRIR
ncbi:hypothetical protein NSTC745_03210 [Nostoc sp. DSM 114161]|jgi:hypothetical protein